MIGEKYKRLLRDTGVFAVGSLGSKLILFFLVPLYTNYMTDTEFGTADLVLTVGQLLVPFASVVVFDSIVRFGLSKNVHPQDVLLNGLLVCTVGGAVTICITPLFDLYAAIADWKWFLAVYVIFNMFNSVLMNYLKVKDMNKLYAGLSIIQTLALAVSNIALLCYGHLGIFGYLVSIIVSSGLCLLLAFSCGRLWRDLKKASFQWDLLKDMLVFSFPLVLNNVSWWIIQSSDKVMIDVMLGAAALGVFTVATKIPAVINVMIMIFSQAWGLSSVREYEGSNDGQFYSNVLKCYQMIAFGAALLFIAFVQPFMSIYVGADFSEAWKYTPLLLASAAFSAISSYYGSIYSVLKKSVNNMLTTLLAAAVNIVVNYVGIMLIGLWGAAIGTFISYVVIAFARMINAGKYIDISVDWRLLIANAIIVMVEMVCVSMELFAPMVSAVCMILFALNNKSVISRLIK